MARNNRDAPWQKFCPRSDAAGVMAAQLRQPFAVSTNRGELAGQANDYLVKHAADQNVEYPGDVWPVAQAVFERTYERWGGTGEGETVSNS